MAALIPFLALATIITINLFDIAIARATPQPKFSAILIFGDSTVDTGNNNYISTVFRGNHSPYGRDFPNHIPTGRFSNGKLLSDFAASLLGIKETVPPFLDPSLSDDDIRTGVCFASAGSGYDELTSAETGVIPLSKQLEMFQKYITRLQGVVGEEEGRRIVGNALIILSAGTNDFVDNYYDLPTRKEQFSVSGYQDFLLNVMQSFVKELYNQGGRSIAVAGMPPTGCLPIQRTIKFQNPTDPSCVEDQNADSRSYNGKLADLLPKLMESLPGSRIALADVYNPLMDMVNRPQKYGFVETRRGCCGTGLLEAGGLCHPATPTCKTASQYLFWDSIHPTEAAYKQLFDRLYEQLVSELPTLL